MKRRTISLHYCNRCRMTTRHTETLEAATCTRCGTENLMGRAHGKVRHNHAAPAPDEAAPEWAEPEWN